MLSTPDKMARPEHETLCLISIWGEDSIQAQIEGCTRNKEVYDRVAEQMREEGYSHPTEGLLCTAVLLLHVLDACSLDCCIAREKKSCAILFCSMIIACASEYARLACMEVMPTYWSGSLCQRASCKQGLAQFSRHGLARLGSARFDTALV